MPTPPFGRVEFLGRADIAAQINDATTLIGAAVRGVVPTGSGAIGPALRLDTLPFNVDAGRRYVGSIYGQPIATDPATGNRHVVNWRDDQHPAYTAWDITTQAWSTPFDLTTITGNPFGNLIDDSHNTMAIAVHEGVVHIAGNMHTDVLKYARTDGTGATSTFVAGGFGSDVANFTSVSYLQFFIVAGQLFATWRQGNSSAGKMMLKRFDRGSLTWATAQAIADGDVSGEGPYPSKPLIFEDTAAGVAKFGFFLTWRTDSISGSNNGYTFIETTDLGQTWKRADGTTQTMPMTHANSVDVHPVVTGSGFVNQCGGTYDYLGRPYGFLTLYDGVSGAGNTQYYAKSWDGTAWVLEQLTRFTSRVDTSTNTLFLSTSRPDGLRAGKRVYLIGKTLYDGKNDRPLIIDATRGASHTPAPLADLDLAGWEPSAIDDVGAQKYGRLNLFLNSVDQVADSELNWDRQWAGLLSIRTDALDQLVRGAIRIPRLEVRRLAAADRVEANVGGTVDADVSTKLPRAFVSARDYAKGTVLQVQARARVTFETGTTSATLYLRAAPSAGSQASVDVAKMTLANSSLTGYRTTPAEPLPLYVETDGTVRDTILTPRVVADNAAGVRVEAFEVVLLVLVA